ncbi:MAG: hypothetical protein ACRD2R_00675, partial [Terriglobales bacterium]
MIKLHLVTFLFALALGFALTILVRKLAVSRQWIVPPDSSRHIHSVPVPRLGGIAVFVSFAGVLGALFLLAHLFHWNLEIATPTLLAILLPAILV